MKKKESINVLEEFGRFAKRIFYSQRILFLIKREKGCYHGKLKFTKEVLVLLMEDIDDLQDKLAELEREHRELDQEIDRLSHTTPVDLLLLQRLKKKKLHLKDQIQKIKSDILPDIIA